jgi:hypothetical protein
MSSRLVDTHPRLGVAAWQARWEQDITGDRPAGTRFCEILSHETTIGRCGACGAPEERHIVTDRMLVGCNAGQVRRTWLIDRDCPHGRVLSTWRQPW